MSDQSELQEIKDFIHIINGEEHHRDNGRVSYEEVVALSFPTPASPETRYTVTYRHAKAPKPDGSLVAGQSVEIEENRTVFNVTATTKS